MPVDRESQHKPVLLRESVSPLLENRGTVYVDCTLGGGGHLELILKEKPQAKVFAFDRDEEMIENARKRFQVEVASGRLTLIHSNYGAIRERLLEKGVDSVDGILVDAGVSSFQLDQPERGFSFLRKGPLDMRMDRSQPLTAYEVVNRWPQAELERVFYRYGEERFSRKIAARIVEKRAEASIDDTIALAKIVEDCLPRQRGAQRGAHPATRVFQAIRIAVNKELEDLEKLLAEIPGILKPGGVIAVITFHSLEDRLVKERFKYLTANCVCPPEILLCDRCNKPPGFLLHKKPIVPSEKEIRDNPRARSAKLRIFVRNFDEIRRAAVDGER